MSLYPHESIVQSPKKEPCEELVCLDKLLGSNQQKRFEWMEDDLLEDPFSFAEEQSSLMFRQLMDQE
jgi:hypothetical protein